MLEGCLQRGRSVTNKPIEIPWSSSNFCIEHIRKAFANSKSRSLECMLDALGKLSMATAAGEVVQCSNCDFRNEAEWTCVNCISESGEPGVHMCSSCIDTHNKVKALNFHTIIRLSFARCIPQSRRSFCSKHKDKELEYCCESCGIGVCQSCVITNHAGHKLVTTDEGGFAGQLMMAKMGEEIESLAQKAQLRDINLQQRSDQLQHHKEKLQRQANKEIDDIIAMLETRRRQLGEEIEDAFGPHEDSLQARHEALQATAFHLQACGAVLELTHRVGTPLDSFEAARLVQDKLRALPELVGEDVSESEGETCGHDPAVGSLSLQRAPVVDHIRNLIPDLLHLHHRRPRGGANPSKGVPPPTQAAKSMSSLPLHHSSPLTPPQRQQQQQREQTKTQQQQPQPWMRQQARESGLDSQAGTRGAGRAAGGTKGAARVGMTLRLASDAMLQPPHSTLPSTHVVHSPMASSPINVTPPSSSSPLQGHHNQGRAYFDEEEEEGEEEEEEEEDGDGSEVDGDHTNEVDEDCETVPPPPPPLPPSPSRAQHELVNDSLSSPPGAGTGPSAMCCAVSNRVIGGDHHHHPSLSLRCPTGIAMLTLPPTTAAVRTTSDGASAWCRDNEEEKEEEGGDERRRTFLFVGEHDKPVIKVVDSRTGMHVRSLGNAPPNGSVLQAPVLKCPSGMVVYTPRCKPAVNGRDHLDHAWTKWNGCDPLLFVADSKSDRVQVFNATNGDVLGAIGGAGTGPGKLSGPAGLAIWDRTAPAPPAPPAPPPPQCPSPSRLPQEVPSAISPSPTSSSSSPSSSYSPNPVRGVRDAGGEERGTHIHGGEERGTHIHGNYRSPVQLNLLALCRDDDDDDDDWREGRMRRERESLSRVGDDSNLSNLRSKPPAATTGAAGNGGRHDEVEGAALQADVATPRARKGGGGLGSGSVLLFVSEGRGGRVQVFDALSGRHVRFIGSARPLRGPHGLALLCTSISSFSSHSSNPFPPPLSPSPAASPSSLYSPSDHYRSAKEEVGGMEGAREKERGNDALLFVAESEQHRVLVFNARTGVLLRCIGRTKDTKWLSGPTGLALYYPPSPPPARSTATESQLEHTSRPAIRAENTSPHNSTKVHGHGVGQGLGHGNKGTTGTSTAPSPSSSQRSPQQAKSFITPILQVPIKLKTPPRRSGAGSPGVAAAAISPLAMSSPHGTFPFSSSPAFPIDKARSLPSPSTSGVAPSNIFASHTSPPSGGDEQGTVDVFLQQGRVTGVGHWGGHGRGGDRCSWSACGPLLLVADTDNHRIQVFAALTGKWISTIGAGRGLGVGQLYVPLFLSVLDSGEGRAEVMVAEAGNNRIQVFDI